MSPGAQVVTRGLFPMVVSSGDLSMAHFPSVLEGMDVHRGSEGLNSCYMCG